MRCAYLEKKEFLSNEDRRIHTACICRNKKCAKYKTFGCMMTYMNYIPRTLNEILESKGGTEDGQK